MFVIPGLAGSERTAEIIFDVAEIIVSWTCAVCATGYARQYLNTDSRFRKEANEAIYPFYLLHQPLIVVTAYFVTQYEIADWLKALLIIDASLLLFVLAYRYFIRPFNAARVLFGMKIKSKPGKSFARIAPAEVSGNNADRA
jgi:peptidoglycan/LPS O-acetylase OafA/YrhL